MSWITSASGTSSRARTRPQTTWVPEVSSVAPPSMFATPPKLL
uniref:Uncharacterized protein n=1 Tax=Arundo donax TaxID=35708 RepID=A0A0A9BJD8_ARUDO